MTGSRVFENARILWNTPSAPGKECNFPVDIKLNGILPWQKLLYSTSQEAYMPNSCFSYSADVPPGTGTRDALQPDPPSLRRMPESSGCFRYEADVPPGLRRMPTTTSCFRYEADVPPGLRRMPAACFSY
jgi:hypothetical protein